MTIIKLEYGNLENQIFKLLRMATAPLLIQTIADQLQQPPATIEQQLEAMVGNGSPLRFTTTSAGKAVELAIGSIS